MAHPSPPTSADIDAALRGTRYEGAKSIAVYNNDTTEADFEAADAAIVNTARALTLERALKLVLETDFRNTNSISTAFNNARETLSKWGQT